MVITNYKIKGRRYAHRVIMEEFLGRKLLPNEIIHHINGLKNDNRIENLKLYQNNTTHAKENHSLGRIKRMKLRKFYIREDQDQALAELPGNKAEHVRAALDVYLPEKQRELISASASSSMKGGENGRGFNIPSTEEEN